VLCGFKLYNSFFLSDIIRFSQYNWAKFRTAKGGVKIHTSLDVELMLPDVVNISEAKVHDCKGLEQLVFPQNTIIVDDRGYFDFTLMMSRIAAKNIFVTRIKSNTVYETIEEIDLPDGENEHIVKDEIIRLTSKKAKDCGINDQELRLVHVYKEDENKIIEIITNQLEWDALTIAELYKKRWDIELFFKALKQNLQVKTFVGTSENAVKSQIYIAMITFMLPELIRRTMAKKLPAFSNFVERIRMSLCFCLLLDYVFNAMGERAKRIKQNKQMKIPLLSDFFSQNERLSLYG